MIGASIVALLWCSAYREYYDLLHKKALTGMDDWVGQQVNQQRTGQIIVVGPCPTISKNGLTHCLITFQILNFSL